MKRVRMVAMIIAGLALSACSSLDMATRNAPFDAPDAAAVAPAMNVVSYQVHVPKTLKVSEANSYFPSADIVWHGDPIGDRYEQIGNIFKASLERGVFPVQNGVPVALDIEVSRFHALSEKTRYSSLPGDHSIRFTMRILDPKTGKEIAPARELDASFRAYTGGEAIVAESKGITQKVRVTNHLAGFLQHELGLTKEVARAANSTTDASVTRNATSAPLKQGDLKQGDPTSGLF